MLSKNNKRHTFDSMGECGRQKWSIIEYFIYTRNPITYCIDVVHFIQTSWSYSHFIGQESVSLLAVRNLSNLFAVRNPGTAQIYLTKRLILFSLLSLSVCFPWEWRQDYYGRGADHNMTPESLTERKPKTSGSNIEIMMQGWTLRTK